MLETKRELQVRLDLLEEILGQLQADGETKEVLQEAFGLFADRPQALHAHETDLIWWKERVHAIRTRYGLHY
jgi:hypothetical protein